jgi:orotate phosphoribosyltransferase
MPRFNRRFVSLAKKPSTALSQDADVGVKWKVQRGCPRGYAASKVKEKNVFVIDDLITRGSTLSRIAAAIKAANLGTKVYGIALAKTDRRSFWDAIEGHSGQATGASYTNHRMANPR